MVDPKKKRYFYQMMSFFGAISLSVVLFFLIYRLQDIAAVLKNISDILAPFVYGGVVAYLLRPMCNLYESIFNRILPAKFKGLSNAIAVGLSLISGMLVVYMLIIMIAPQLYDSIRSLWISLPDKVNSFLIWARGIFGEDEELLHMVDQTYTALYSELDKWGLK